MGGILEDLVYHKPCIGVFFELMAEAVSYKRLHGVASAVSKATYLVESSLGSFLLWGDKRVSTGKLESLEAWQHLPARRDSRRKL